MKLEIKNINELKPHPQNVRRHTEKQLVELEKSVTQFGVIRPVVIDEDNVILVGHGLVEALRRLGKENVQVHQVKDMTDSQKKKLMLADNKIYSLGFDNYEMIDEIMQELDDFDIPGFDFDTLEALYSEEEEIEELTLDEYEIEDKEVEMLQDRNEEPREPTPSFQEEKRIADKEANTAKFVLCPNCGTKIELD